MGQSRKIIAQRHVSLAMNCFSPRHDKVGKMAHLSPRKMARFMAIFFLLSGYFTNTFAAPFSDIEKAEVLGADRSFLSDESDEVLKFSPEVIKKNASIVEFLKEKVETLNTPNMLEHEAIETKEKDYDYDKDYDNKPAGLQEEGEGEDQESSFVQIDGDLADDLSRFSDMINLPGKNLETRKRKKKVRLQRDWKKFLKWRKKQKQRTRMAKRILKRLTRKLEEKFGPLGELDIKIPQPQKKRRKKKSRKRKKKRKGRKKRRKARKKNLEID